MPQRKARLCVLLRTNIRGPAPRSKACALKPAFKKDEPSPETPRASTTVRPTDRERRGARTAGKTPLARILATWQRARTPGRWGTGRSAPFAWSPSAPAALDQFDLFELNEAPRRNRACASQLIPRRSTNAARSRWVTRLARGARVLTTPVRAQGAGTLRSVALHRRRYGDAMAVEAL